MTESSPPIGQRFTSVYLERSEPTRDSRRFRARLGNFLDSSSSHNTEDAAEEIALEIGERVDTGYEGYQWSIYIKRISINDLLDSITIMYQSFVVGTNPHFAREFHNFVARAFREENVGYRIDEKGGVHFYADEDFERSRTSTISGLDQPRYGAAAEAYEDAHAALSGAEPDTLLAVRRAFDAVENLFKMMFSVPRLGATEVKSKLGPDLPQTYPGRAGDSAKLLADGFASWVNAAHQFRHAPGVPDPSPPPLGLALVMVSSAGTYLRWLRELDEHPSARAPS
jgi:hypothetical protein